MRGWCLSPWRILVLAGVLAAILLVVAIPDQWDLPDTAFQSGTAPLVVHSRTVSTPSLLGFGAPVTVAISQDIGQPARVFQSSFVKSVSLSVLISLRC